MSKDEDYDPYKGATRRIAEAPASELAKEGWSLVQSETSVSFEGERVTFHANGELTLPKMGRVIKDKAFVDQVETKSGQLLVMRQERGVSLLTTWESRAALPVNVLFTPHSFALTPTSYWYAYKERSGWFFTEKDIRR